LEMVSAAALAVFRRGRGETGTDTMAEAMMIYVKSGFGFANRVILLIFGSFHC
jgi:hypothetical protein